MRDLGLIEVDSLTVATQCESDTPPRDSGWFSVHGNHAIPFPGRIRRFSRTSGVQPDFEVEQQNEVDQPQINLLYGR
ncbi:hypothetical protein [Actinoplanes sp. GCM10030250]|uniref:hypothetical protein n=1 Tax=Actinoplanes sp. GCM10030250 TaxID=3273376 RepID=UPI00360FED51